eukprot:scaffold4363_cov125-Cylindrotheca_fusiformis.AAC.7
MPEKVIKILEHLLPSTCKATRDYDFDLKGLHSRNMKGENYQNLLSKTSCLKSQVKWNQQCSLFRLIRSNVIFCTLAPPYECKFRMAGT